MEEKKPKELLPEKEWTFMRELSDFCGGWMMSAENTEQEKHYDDSVVNLPFIHSASAPQTPFVTVEYSPEKHKILQCHGDHNSEPEQEVKEYIYKKWLPYANRQIKKIAA